MTVNSEIDILSPEIGLYFGERFHSILQSSVDQRHGDVALARMDLDGLLAGIPDTNIAAQFLSSHLSEVSEVILDASDETKNQVGLLVDKFLWDRREELSDSQLLDFATFAFIGSVQAGSALLYRSQFRHLLKTDEDTMLANERAIVAGLKKPESIFAIQESEFRFPDSAKSPKEVLKEGRQREVIEDIYTLAGFTREQVAVVLDEMMYQRYGLDDVEVQAVQEYAGKTINPHDAYKSHYLQVWNGLRRGLNTVAKLEAHEAGMAKRLFEERNITAFGFWPFELLVKQFDTVPSDLPFTVVAEATGDHNSSNLASIRRADRDGLGWDAANIKILGWNNSKELEQGVERLTKEVGRPVDHLVISAHASSRSMRARGGDLRPKSVISISNNFLRQDARLDLLGCSVASGARSMASKVGASSTARVFGLDQDGNAVMYLDSDGALRLDALGSARMRHVSRGEQDSARTRRWVRSDRRAARHRAARH